MNASCRVRGAPSVETRGEQLLGVQGIALAAREQPFDQLLTRLIAEDVREHLVQLTAVKRRQVEPPRSLEAVELGQQRAQRMPAVQLIGPVGEQQQDPLLAKAPCEKFDEPARRAVRAVHVLQDQHHRLLVAEQVEQLQQRFEQSQLARAIPAMLGQRSRIVVVQTREQRGQLNAASAAEPIERRVAFADQRAQRAQQGCVRKLGLTLLDGLPPEDERAGACQLLELTYQPALADARVTSDQDQRWAPIRRLGERQLQLRELSRSPDEVGAREPHPHVPSIARMHGGLPATSGAVHRRPRSCGALRAAASHAAELS